MKKKTYGNVVKAGKMLQKKGYEEKEAMEIAMRLFDDLSPGMDVETSISRVLSKDEWEKECELACLK